MSYVDKPFYLEFPILQISYILFWIPIGFFVSKVISSVVIFCVFYIFSSILGTLYPLDFELFVLSKRLKVLVYPFYSIAAIFFDFIILIIGLELISCFLNKKRKEISIDEYSDYGQN